MGEIGLRVACQGGGRRECREEGGHSAAPFAIRHSGFRKLGLMCPGGTLRALSLKQANTVIAATFAAARKHKCRPMSAIVLDAGGRVKAFQRQDNASMLRFEVCYGKAYGRWRWGGHRNSCLQKANEKPLFMQSIENLADYPLFLEGGGQLIRDPDRRGGRRHRRHRRRQ